MYSYEDRLRAVQLYIKLGKRIRLTIQRSWDIRRRTHSRPGTASTNLAPGACAAGYKRPAKVFPGAEGAALSSTTSSTANPLRRRSRRWAIPARTLLSAWLQELASAAQCTRVVGRSQGTGARSQAVCCDCPSARARPARRLWPKRLACRGARCTSGRINCSATTHPHP